MYDFLLYKVFSFLYEIMCRYVQSLKGNLKGKKAALAGRAPRHLRGLESPEAARGPPRSAWGLRPVLPPRWGKNFARRRPCGIPHESLNFLDRGEGMQRYLPARASAYVRLKLPPSCPRSFGAFLPHFSAFQPVSPTLPASWKIRAHTCMIRSQARENKRTGSITTPPALKLYLISSK